MRLDMKKERREMMSMTRLLSLALSIVMFALLRPALALDDVTPFFAGRSGMPNVMILFDNSNSMQDSPYKRKNGNPYNPYYDPWTKGVVPTSDNDPACAAGAPCIDHFDYTNGYRMVDEHGNVKTELTLPGQNPPNLPGLFSASSTVTPASTTPDVVYNGSDCSGKKCSNRIYDNSVSWSDLTAAIMQQRYQNWKVTVTEKESGAVQERTLIGYDASSGYWKVSPPDIEYTKNKYYIYRIEAGLPGEVTKKSDPIGEKDIVYDRNFNWRAIINDRDFDFMYKGKTIKITEGTNAGEERTITGRNVTLGYWEVDSDFSAPCDLTSKYSIHATPEFITNTLEKMRADSGAGGNHPASKMYQAKKALQKFLLSDKVRQLYTNPITGETKQRYLMNVGFASFMQALIPRTVGFYYRKIAAVDDVVHTYPAGFYYKFRYRYYHNATAYMPDGCVNGAVPTKVTFDLWGKTYSNKRLHDAISRNWTASNCFVQQKLCYKITSITCAPIDSLPNRVRIDVETDPDWSGNPPNWCAQDPDGRHNWGATEYTWEEIDVQSGWDTDSCQEHRPALPSGADGWVESGDQCYEDCGYAPANSWTEYGNVEYYQTRWRSTTGDLRQTDPDYMDYVDRTPAPDKAYLVTPTPGYSGGSWSRITNPDPEPASGDGDYTLLTSANEKTNVCLKIRSDGTCKKRGDILAKDHPIGDYSYFKYPGKDGGGGNLHAKYPHGWSYQRTRLDPALSSNGQYRLRHDNSWLIDNSTTPPSYHYFSDADDRFIYSYGNKSGPSIWGESQQRSPYYPALTGNDFSNWYGEDQVFFVNLPKYDDDMFNYGDDYDGDNVKRILNRVNLALHLRYDKKNYFTTMAPGNPGSLAASRKTAEPGNGTPIAATLQNAKKYFESYIHQDPLSLGGCRKNYIILLTDGTDTTDGDPVQAASDLWNLTVDGRPAPVRVFVVGFGLGAAERAVLNNIAAAGGPADEDGNPAQAYFANNIDELVNILTEEIASIVTAGSYSRAKAALPKAGVRKSDGLTVYNTYFDYPGWRGHLEAYDVYQKNEYDSSGNRIVRAGDIKGPSSHWATGCSGVYSNYSNPGSPDAGCIMAEDNPNPDSPTRVVYTTVTTGGTTTRADFSANTLTDATLGTAFRDKLVKIGGSYVDINEDGTFGDNTDAEDVIGYVLHPGYQEGKYVGTRTKVWPLADIYNSSPVVVSAPYDRGCVAQDTDGDGTVDKSDSAEWYWENMTGYCQYNYLKRNRKTVLYFGTNGGMIEAISAGRAAIPDDPSTTVNESVSAIDGGEELWGFIPEFVLPNLHNFKDGHRFTMDLTVDVAEVDTSDDLAGTGWKTILVAGQRKGGNSYVALDVTDPDNPQYLWTFTDDNIGETWSRPSVARLEIHGHPTSVFIFGGGYSSDSNKGNRIYIVKASDGTLLKEITVGGSTNNVPARVLTIRYLTDNNGDVIDYRTNATFTNSNNRRDYIEAAYFGDTDGNIWRLEDLNSDSSTTWNPKVVKLYQPDSAHAQPIYHMVRAVDRRSATCIQRFILAGTGDENNPVALKTGGGKPLINYFFEIQEDTSGSDVTNDSKLTWRISLGKEFPRDKYGFLLKPDNSGRYQHNGKKILSSYIFILDRGEYDGTGNPWAIDSAGNLTYKDSGSTTAVLAAEKGEFLFKDSAGNLYEHPTGGVVVETAGSYDTLDFSTWLTNHNGDFYNSANGDVIIPKSVVSQYYYDNEGYWCDGSSPCTKRKVDGKDVKIVVDMGEKMLTTPDGYGDQVYFMTYTPKGGCGIGQSYFYGVKASKYSCGSALVNLGGTGLLKYGPGTAAYTNTRKFFHSPQRRIGLGAGIANFTLGGTSAFIGHNGEINALPLPLSPRRLMYWKQN